MQKTVGEGGVGVIPGLVITHILHNLIIQAGYLEDNRSKFDKHIWEHEQKQDD